MAESNEMSANVEFDDYNNSLEDTLKKSDIIPRRRPLATDPGTESSKRRPLDTDPGTESSKRRPLDTDPGTESSKMRPLDTDPGTESSKRRPLDTDPGTESSKMKPSDSVCLVLLCFLLLAGIKCLLVYYNKVIDSYEERIFIFNNAINIMITERYQLQVEGDELQTKLSVIEQHAQEGWRYYNSSLYLVSAVRKTWNDSRQDCLRRGADLVIINSREEQVFVHGLTEERFWFGLTDRVEEGKWVWMDGTKLTTGYWDRELGQPDSLKKTHEDCAARFGSKQVESWHDARCYQEHIWICEKSLPVPDL